MKTEPEKSDNFVDYFTTRFFALEINAMTVDLVPFSFFRKL